MRKQGFNTGCRRLKRQGKVRWNIFLATACSSAKTRGIKSSRTLTATATIRCAFWIFALLSGAPYDPHMKPALDWLTAKQNKNGKWPLELVHKGNAHFDMETAGQPSRFITLKARQILNNYVSA